jgi:hypothetical protein
MSALLLGMVLSVCIIIIIIIIIIIAIELSLGGSSLYNSKYIRIYIIDPYTNTIQTTQNTINTSTHYENTHTYTNQHITKPAEAKHSTSYTPNETVTIQSSTEEEYKLFQNPSSRLSNYTCQKSDIKYHTDYPQTLDAVVQNLSPHDDLASRICAPLVKNTILGATHAVIYESELKIVSSSYI